MADNCEEIKVCPICGHKWNEEANVNGCWVCGFTLRCGCTNCQTE